MIQFAALIYGVLASFIVSSATRNRREARDNPPELTLFAWALMSFSAATGALLLGYAGMKAAGVA
jgi:choline-glycine betaine transporter